MKRQRTVAKRLGKLGDKSINFTDKFKADVFDNGSCDDPTECGITVYAPNPQLGLQKDDWVQITETEDSICLAEPVISASRQLLVVTVFGDYLECVFHEGFYPLTLNGPSIPTVNVAKPQELRKSDFEGQTIPNADGEEIEFTDFTANGQERTATRTLPSTVENQRVVPRYLDERLVDALTYPGSLIIAKFQPAGTGTVDEDGKILYWEDSNHAGREWAQKFE